MSQKFRGTLVWNDPYIIYSGSYISESREITPFDEVTSKLHEKKAIFLVLVAWSAEHQTNAENLVAWAKKYIANKNHRIIFMCNTLTEADIIRSCGGEAAFLHQNALVDPTLFTVDHNAIKKYDAVYNAQFLSFKRHELCADIKRLALMSYNMDKAYYENVVKPLNNYSLLNTLVEDKLGWLGFNQVSRIYNESYSGLCLSAEEGGMHASIEYLLSGLPIVTTNSKGGRDYFFDEYNSIYVDDAPFPVAAAVATQKSLYSKERAEKIRVETIARQEIEIAKYKKFIGLILDENNKYIDIESLWKKMYKDKLISMEEISIFFSKGLAKLND